MYGIGTRVSVLPPGGDPAQFRGNIRYVVAFGRKGTGMTCRRTGTSRLLVSYAYRPTRKGGALCRLLIYRGMSCKTLVTTKISTEIVYRVLNVLGRPTRP